MCCYYKSEEKTLKFSENIKADFLWQLRHNLFLHEVAPQAFDMVFAFLGEQNV